MFRETHNGTVVESLEFRRRVWSSNLLLILASSRKNLACTADLLGKVGTQVLNKGKGALI